MFPKKHRDFGQLSATIPFCLLIRESFTFFTFLDRVLGFSYSLRMASERSNEPPMQRSIQSHRITAEKSFDIHRDRATSPLLDHYAVFIYFSQLFEQSCTPDRWKSCLFYAFGELCFFQYHFSNEFLICYSIPSSFGRGQRLFFSSSYESGFVKNKEQQFKKRQRAKKKQQPQKTPQNQSWSQTLIVSGEYRLHLATINW